MKKQFTLTNLNDGLITTGPFADVVRIACDVFQNEHGVDASIIGGAISGTALTGEEADVMVNDRYDVVAYTKDDSITVQLVKSVTVVYHLIISPA